MSYVDSTAAMQARLVRVGPVSRQPVTNVNVQRQEQLPRWRRIMDRILLGLAAVLALSLAAPASPQQGFPGRIRNARKAREALRSEQCQ